MNETLIKLNLQFFSAEDEGRTEQATTKKKDDARKKGQVAKSNELNTAVLIVGFCGIMMVLATFMLTQIKSYMRASFSGFAQYAHIDEAQYLYQVIGSAIKDFLIICVPLWALLVVVALVISLIQVGYQVSMDPFQPKLDKMDPIKGMKRIFSKDTIVSLIISLAKVSVLSVIVLNMIKERIPTFIKLYNMPPHQSFSIVGQTILQIGFATGGAFLAIAVIDYIYQRYKHNEGLKMTKQEVKEEYKNAEGDPLIKGKIKQKMREGSMRRMMQAVPDADVIITNPTHFAVAIKYDADSSSAPVVVAKGIDYVAQKIKEKAKECDIHIVENKPLARSLYYTVDLDREIPPELYSAVAEVLAFVYNLNEKKNDRRK